MKKIYQAPEVQIIEMQIQDSVMLATSEQEVAGTNGGWVKGESTSSSSSSPSRYNVWDDDWSAE